MLDSDIEERCTLKFNTSLLCLYFGSTLTHIKIWQKFKISLFACFKYLIKFAFSKSHHHQKNSLYLIHLLPYNLLHLNYKASVKPNHNHSQHMWIGMLIDPAILYFFQATMNVIKCITFLYR